MALELDHEEHVRVKVDGVLIGWLVRPYRPAGRRRAEWMVYHADRSGPMVTTEWRIIRLKGTAEQVADEAVRLIEAENAQKGPDGPKPGEPEPIR